MITFQILLWIAVIALAALVTRLARHVGIFQKRIAPASVFTLHQKAIVGDVSCHNTPKVLFEAKQPSVTSIQEFPANRERDI